MKKTGFIICVTLVLALLVSASVWEGTAASAVAGDLPEKGFYAATNSFPRNTIVDVTNLENGKTVRVIVAGGIENPGLLAVLSRDAAEAIGLQSKSAGRVRMTQPADPVAFSRFSEGKDSSGDPDYDPRAFANANAIKEPPPPPPPVTLDDAPGPEEASVENFPREIIVADDETGDFAEISIVEIPENYTPPPGPVKNSQGITGEPAPVAAAQPAASTPAPETAQQPQPPAETVAAAQPAAPAESQPPASVASGQPQKTPGTEPSSSEYSLVPAEARPPAPEKQPVPDPSAVIDANAAPAVTQAPPAPASQPPAPQPAAPAPPSQPPAPAPQPPAPAPVSTTEVIIVPIPSFALVEALPAEHPPKEPQKPRQDIDPAMVIPPIPSETAAAPITAKKEKPADSLPNEHFSVPVITSLEKGKYYLQLAALGKAEAVERELAKIGNTWPLAVQPTGSPSKPLYRILLGPLNRGESGALLKRFKGSGYKDAFVRSN